MEGKVKELIDLLNTNLDLHGDARYEVTEKSERNGEHTYAVYNLMTEVEDGEMYFWDKEDVIFNNQYALVGFLIDSIVDIIFEDKGVDIIFKSNSIKIEILN